MALPAAAAAAYQAAASIGPTPPPPRARRAGRSAGAAISRIFSPARSRIPSAPSARANRPPRPGHGQGQYRRCGQFGERRRTHPRYRGGGARQGRRRLPVHHEHADLTPKHNERYTWTPPTPSTSPAPPSWCCWRSSRPAMLTALVVGLGIGLLQALTQIQEQTLVFVPKIVAVFIVLLIALPFAGAAMSGLMTDIAQPHRRLLAERVMHIHLPALSGIVLTYLLVFARVGAMMMLLPAHRRHGRAGARAPGAGAGHLLCADAARCQSAYPAVAPQTAAGAGHPDRPGSHRRRAGRRHGAHHHERAAGGRLSDRHPDRASPMPRPSIPPRTPKARCWAIS